MQATFSRTLSALAAASLAVAAIACGGDAGTTVPNPATAAQSSGSGATGTDSGSTAPSAGPVASVQVGPKAASMQVGAYMLFTAVGFDAGGARVANTKATWRSSSLDVVITSDTGVVYAKAPGTAKVYGMIDGHTDSATVTVTPRSDTTVVTRPDTAIATPPSPVSAFDLTATIAGRLNGADTLHTEVVAGATVTLTRFAGVRGDTLATPEDAGTAVSDANGVVTFRNLAGGGYLVAVTPPSGAPYAELRTGFGPPSDAAYTIRFILPRK